MLRYDLAKHYASAMLRHASAMLRESYFARTARYHHCMSLQAVYSMVIKLHQTEVGHCAIWHDVLVAGHDKKVADATLEWLALHHCASHCSLSGPLAIGFNNAFFPLLLMTTA